MNKKWIAYGVTGAMGIGVLAGGAAAAASTLDLRTGDDRVIPGGELTGRGSSVVDGGRLEVRVSDTSTTVVSAATPSPKPAQRDSVPSVVTPPQPVVPDSPASVASAPAPAPAPAAPAPPAPASPSSPASPVSAASAASVGSN